MKLIFDDQYVIITLDTVKDDFGTKFVLERGDTGCKDPFFSKESYDDLDEALVAYLKAVKYEVNCYSPDPVKFENLSI